MLEINTNLFYAKFYTICLLPRYQSHEDEEEKEDNDNDGGGGDGGGGGGGDGYDNNNLKIHVRNIIKLNSVEKELS